ncbi:MAG: hypothetical protein JXB00_09435 [Bacteroidales bacterium]|nr:hypothetical protein [Bacteroidales bacterium]
MDTSMYYTFSTIAQVLAAFIALSGVFLIFKLQGLKKVFLYQIKRCIQELEILKKNDFDINTDLLRFYLRIKYCGSKVMEEMRSIITYVNEYSDENPACEKQIRPLLGIYNFYAKMDIKRDRVLQLTKRSLISGILTIFLSIIILSTVHIIEPHYYCTLSIIGISGAIISILFMVATILLTLKDEGITRVDSK